MTRDLLDPETDNRRLGPEDTPVQLNVKVPWHYREQLVRLAKEGGLSLNRFVVNALVRSVPPERR
jgi:predicted HicB family RNase H-like nuclease